MPYNSKVYRILIASPSDVEEEREIVARVIQEWNDLHSYNRKVVLLPLRWETHSAPQMGMRPQEIINKEVVDYCDMAVGVFWTRIGSPTGEAQSGTIEEIERVGKAGKIVMLYFSNVKADLDTLDLEQYAKLKEFKKKNYPNGLVENYKSTLDFRDKFSKQLEIKLRKLIAEIGDEELDNFDNTPQLEVGFVNVETGEKYPDDLPLKINAFVTESDKQIKEKLEKAKVKKEKLENFQSELKKHLLKESSKRFSFYLKNIGPVGIRDIYIEFRIGKSKEISIFNSFGHFDNYLYSYSIGSKNTDIRLEETDNEYIFYFSYSALQPQRTLSINDYLNISSSKSQKVEIRYTIFADCFPSPISKTMSIDLESKRNIFDSNNFIVDYKEKMDSSRLLKLPSLSPNFFIE